MTVQVTYPGVYIEEIPSGNHTITGVPTAVTAFIGRAPKGPVDEATAVTSLGDFEQFFGGLDFDYPLTYAVRDFFLNGGSEAIIIRRYKAQAATPAAPPKPKDAAGKDPNAKDAGSGSTPDASPAAVNTTAAFSLGGLTMTAASPGSWGNDIAVSSDTDGITAQVAELYKNMYGLQKSDLFNLSVYYKNKLVEQFKCVTIKKIKNNANRVDLTLEHESNFVRIAGDLPASFTSPAPVKKPDGSSSPQLSQVTKKGEDSADLTDSNDYLGDPAGRTGLYALEKVDVFNLLCIPPDPLLPDSVLTALNPAAAAYCEKRRALFIAEPLEAWKAHAETGQWANIQPTDLAINGDTGRYATTYFPRVKMADPEMQDRVRVFSSCGIIAGVMATNDLNRGVWKAPAGQDAGMVGVVDLEVKINDADNGFLNPLGINCLRKFPVIGPVVWGDRTLRGADMLSDDYKYVSVRRLTNYIEESLRRGTQWAVFEDNDESLWSQLRLSIGAFMKDLSIQGAFYNYKVICDASTTTPDDIAKGIVNVDILFAPVKPAEFVVLKFQQTAATV